MCRVKSPVPLNNNSPNEKKSTDIRSNNQAPAPRGEYQYLGPGSTAFQAKTCAVGQAAEILQETGIVYRKIVINLDCQTTILAVTGIRIKSKTISVLNEAKLGEHDKVLLR